MFEPISEDEPIAWVHTRAEELLKEFGLKEQGWRFELSNKAQALGTCYHSKKLIVFSIHYLESPREEIEDTLRHEIAHALAGPGNGHNWLWKHYCREVGADPTRTSHNYVRSKPWNWKLTCPTCGAVWYRYRARKNLIHPRCNDAPLIYERLT